MFRSLRYFGGLTGRVINNKRDFAVRSAEAQSLPSLSPESERVTVNAYFIGRKIDLARANSALCGNDVKPIVSKKLSLIDINPELHQYISISTYGGVVLFNIPEVQHMEYLRIVKDNAVISKINEDKLHNENYKVIIQEQLGRPFSIKAEHLNVRALDYTNIAVVSTVMAQTVALDYYAEAVNDMMTKFMQMNQHIQVTNRVGDEARHSLNKLVAENIAVNVAVLSELGIFEGNDATWDNGDYHYTWEGLRKDFEIDLRHKDLAEKLQIIQTNATFYLEVLNGERSNRLEQIIVALISLEASIGIVGLIFPNGFSNLF